VIQPVTSRANDKVKLAVSLKSSSQCRKNRLFLVEGPRFIRDIVKGNLPLEFIFVSEKATYESVGAAELAEADGIVILRLPEHIFRDISSTEHSQGIAAVAPLPSHRLSDVFNGGTVLALDGVSDPGNAGTAIRSAAAFNCSGVVFLSGSVFPWNSKVTRSSAGLNSLLPVVEEESLAGIKHQFSDYLFLGASPDGESISTAITTNPLCIIVGSEAHGLSETSLSRMTGSVGIPMAEGVESLNAGVSASIILYELFRRKP